MDYRINKQEFLDNISVWNSFLRKKIYLFACGGTAMTLMGIKESTKDIDLVCPDEKEYDYLIKTLKQLGYTSVRGSGWSKDNRLIFEIFRGKRVHTTELLETPKLSGNHILIKEFNYIYFAVLNYYDLIISKLFRSSRVDIDDCLQLIKSRRKEIDINRLIDRYRLTASFDVAEERVNRNLDIFLSLLKKEGSENGA